ncbi:histidine phosphatase family protein [Sinomonas sp.]|uniref:histidine phosphatase family protein n=1 Tax=Sinomonas sp. TaxID=1914986 RepID=UPI002FE35F0D
MAPQQLCFHLDRVSAVRDGRPVLENVTLGFPAGAKVGLVGPDGPGKSTLLGIIAGITQPTTGHAVTAPGLSVGMLPRKPTLDEDGSVQEIVEEGVRGAMGLLQRFGDLTDELAAHPADCRLAELGHLQAELDRHEAWDLRARLAQTMQALHCPPGHTPVRGLTGSERQRVALCRVLLRQPDLLLLDEPTDDLDADSAAWLGQHLRAYPGTVIAATADRCFLDDAADWILELDRGHASAYQGNYTAYREDRQNRARPFTEGRKPVNDDSASSAHDLYLVRHGRTALNAQGRLRGLADPALDEAGIAEAERLARDLAATAAAMVVSGPLERARRTAQIIAQATSIPHLVDERFNDRDYGPQTGRVKAEVEAEYGSVDAAPGVEPAETVLARARPALDDLVLLDDLVDRDSPRPVIVVTHDAVIRPLIGALDATRVLEAPTGSWNLLRREGGSWVVVAVDQKPPQD